MNSRVAALVVATMLWLAGCGDGAAPAGGRATGESALPGGGQPANVSAEAAATPEIELTPVNQQEFDALLAKRRGQVVLVDFWATWCTPCLAQLPHTAELASRRAPDGLAVITVSMDDEGAASAAKSQLAKRASRPEVTHLISKLGGGPAAMEAFEIGSGAVPHYKLYDRTGQLNRVFETDPAADKPFTSEDIDAAVDELLAEPRPPS